MKLNLAEVKLAMARECIGPKGLSKKTGIPYPTIIPYLNGKREPGTEALGKIAKALSVDVTEILKD